MQLKPIKVVRGYKAPPRITVRPSGVAANGVQRQFTVVWANQVCFININYNASRVKGECRGSNEPLVFLVY